MGAKGRNIEGNALVGTVTAAVFTAVTTTQMVQRGENESASFQIVINTFDQLRWRACFPRSSVLFLSDPCEASWTTTITTFYDLNSRQIFTPASCACTVVSAAAKTFSTDRTSFFSQSTHQDLIKPA